MFKIRKKDFKTSLIVALILVLINVLVVKILGLEDFSFSTSAISLPVSLVISVAFAITHIVISYILRYKRKQEILKGIFIYQICGAVSFVILFIFLLAGSNISFFRNIFIWWSLPLEPIAYIVSLKGFMPITIMRAIVYLIYCTITGNSYVQIKKDISFEKKISEKKAMEEESRIRHN